MDHRALSKVGKILVGLNLVCIAGLFFFFRIPKSSDTPVETRWITDHAIHVKFFLAGFAILSLASATIAIMAAVRRARQNAAK